MICTPEKHHLPSAKKTDWKIYLRDWDTNKNIFKSNVQQSQIPKKNNKTSFSRKEVKKKNLFFAFLWKVRLCEDFVGLSHMHELVIICHYAW